MDITYTTNDVNDIETNVMFDVVDSFFHAINIVKFRIFVSRKDIELNP